MSRHKSGKGSRRLAAPIVPRRSLAWMLAGSGMLLAGGVWLAWPAIALKPGPQRRAEQVRAAAKASSGERLFEPTVANATAAPTPAPSGMVWIPGGEFSMGANQPPAMDAVGMQATTDARPIHRVYVDGFFMDKTDVTNAQFAAFVRATG